ncbi:MAG: hypothetical protein U1A78_02655 [Polyangia bacterium]
MDARWLMVVLVVGLVLLVPAWLGATPTDPEPCPPQDHSQSQSHSHSQASRLRTGPVQPSAPARSGTNSPVPDRAVAPKRAPPTATATTMATATAARGACRSRTAAPLVVPPVVELSRTPAPPPPVVQDKKELPHLKQPIPLEGFPAGDFLIQPTITLATDCRYGDPRSRDRSWMEELDSQDARLRGERKDDPLRGFLKGPGKDNTGKKTDPGYQIAATIGHRLQPVPSTTAPLRALEHPVVIAPGKPDQASSNTNKDALRRSIATITRRPAATGSPTRQATPSARRPRPVRPPHPAADPPIPQMQ